MYDYSPHQGYTRYASLEGLSIFITGGATGIGAALVEAFSAQGAKVAFVDIDTDGAAALGEKIAGEGLARPWFEYCDVSDLESLKQSVAHAAIANGPVSVLINNAANDQRYDTRTLTPAVWHQSLAINLHPVFFAAQAVQPMMAGQGKGVILNISSLNTIWAPPNLASYITAKAGILGVTKALAADFGGDNIRVNAILPGWVATEKQLEKWLTEKEEADLMKRMCLKKRLAAHDVAKLALFLASDDAAMITAQEFIIDGGRT